MITRYLFLFVYSLLIYLFLQDILNHQKSLDDVFGHREKLNNSNANFNS